MSKTLRYSLTLLLCLILFACLLPAAYADGGSLQELKNEIAAFKKNPVQKYEFYTTGDFMINENLEIPKGFQLRVLNTLTIAANKVVTVNGKLDATGAGLINILGTVINNGQTRMFNDGVISVSGTLQNDHDIYYKNLNPYLTHLVINNGASFINNSSLSVQVGTELSASVLGVSVDGWCRAVRGDETDQILYCPPEKYSHFEGMCSSGEFIYLELNGIGNIRVEENMTIPADMEVVMSGTTLVVPNGKTMTVYGKLVAKELVVQQGGSFVLQDGGTLIETKTEAPEIAALRAAIKNGQAGYTLQSNAPIILAEALTIPRNFTLTVGTTLQVMPGTLLTLEDYSSKLVVADESALDVAGTVISSGVIDLSNSGVICISGVFQGNPGSRISVERADMSDIIPRVIIERDGQFNGMGGVMISKSILSAVDRSAIIVGTNLSLWSEAEQNNAAGYFPGKDIDFAIFKSMCESRLFTQFRLRGTGIFRFESDVNIPEGVYVKVRNSSALIVPENVKLTINGKIEASFNGLIRVESGGTMESKNEIYLGDGGVIDVFGTYKNNGRKGLHFWLEAPDAPTPQLIIEDGATYVAGSGFAFDAPVTPEAAVQNINMDNYCHHIDHNNPNRMSYYPANIMTFELMFPEGGQYIDYLEVHGLNTLTLSANVEIPVFDDGTASRVDMSETTLVVPSGMKLTVNGVLIVKNLVVEDGGTVIKGPNGSITYAAGSDIEALRAAIANPEISQFELSGNPFTITEALTIPSDFTVIVGSGSSLEIPAGVDVKLEGRLILREGAVLNVLQTSSANRGRIIGGTLEVDAGSTVNLMGRLEIDKLRLDGTLTTQNSGVWYEFELTDLDNGRPRGRMIISNGGSHSVSSNGLDEAKLQDWVSFEGDQAYLEIAYRVKSDQDLTEMTQRIRNLPARFQGNVRLRYDAVISDDYIFPGIQIRVDGSSGGSLTIAEGAVLTAPTVYLKGAELTVNGTFISIPRNNNHSGAVILQGNTSRLTVSDTGIIGGTDCTIEIGKEITDPEACLAGVKFSQLQDISDPIRVAAGFRTYRFIPELSLPAALNTIESEAFAGGSFSSVYIPAGVTSIAPDAFGDRTDLKVYGEYNTEAETFAAGKGFPFAPSTWS